MKRALWLLLCCALLPAPPVEALDIPPRPSGYVTDLAGLLTKPEVDHFTQRLAAFEAGTTHQVVVAIFPTLDDEPLEDFAIRLAEQWQAGQAGRDNGVIVLIVPQARQVRIEVGYGLEDMLPDAAAHQIIQQQILPHFAQGQYAAGIDAGLTAIMQTLRTAPPANGTMPRGTARDARLGTVSWLLGWGFLALVAILFPIDAVRYLRFRGDHQTYRGRYTFWEWWFRFAFLLIVLKVLFEVAFHMLLASRGGMYSGRGGFGGFSGGGGSFGGGGASGRW